MPDLARLSVKILTLSTSALTYLTIGFISIKLISRVSLELSLQQDEKDACLTESKKKFQLDGKDDACLTESKKKLMVFFIIFYLYLFFLKD